MADKRATANLTTATSNLYTVPAGRTARVLLCQLARTGGAGDSAVSVWVNSSSYLCRDLPLPEKSMLSFLQGLVLQAGDVFKASGANTTITLSFTET